MQSHVQLPTPGLNLQFKQCFGMTPPVAACNAMKSDQWMHKPKLHTSHKHRHTADILHYTFSLMHIRALVHTEALFLFKLTTLDGPVDCMQCRHEWASVACWSEQLTGRREMPCVVLCAHKHLHTLWIGSKLVWWAAPASWIFMRQHPACIMSPFRPELHRCASTLSTIFSSPVTPAKQTTTYLT